MRMYRAGSQKSTSFPLLPRLSSSSTAHPLRHLHFHLHPISLYSFYLLKSLLILCVLIRLPTARCTAVNLTIDDTLGDSVTGQRPVFLPSTLGVWEDETCSGCAIQPSKSLAFDGTWTAATYNEGLGNISCTLNFTGTAIYVFFILANNVAPGITTVTEANFTLDGTLSGHFLHEPDNSTSAPEFLYGNNAMVFSKTGLKNGDHQLIISTSGVNHDVFVNFDYAMYTFENATDATTTTSKGNTPTTTVSHSATASSVITPSEDQSSSSNTGAIAGGTVAGVVVLAALLGAFLFYRRRRARQLSSPGGRGFDESGPESDSMLGPGGQMSQRQQGASSNFIQGSSLRSQTEALDTGVVGDASSYHDSSMYTTTPVTGLATAASNGPTASEFDDDLSSQYTSTGTDVTSPMYQSRSVFTALPTGQVVLTAGRKGKGSDRYRNLAGSLDRRSGIELARSNLGGGPVTPALPSSGNLDSRFSRIELGAGNAHTPVTTLNTTSTTSTPSNPTTITGSSPEHAKRRRLVTDTTPIESLGLLQSAPNTKAEIRHMRQRELERQMREMREEMRDLQREAEEAQAAMEAGVPRRVSVRSRGSMNRRRSGKRLGDGEGEEQSGTAAEDRDNVGVLKDQIRMMSEQIVMLQSQLQSPWAQGLSDEPPPGYEPPEEPHR